MIGRHFVVSSDDALEEKRHYTICNTMQSAVLLALQVLADSAINPETSLNEEQANFDEVFDRSDQDGISLTIKGYPKMGSHTPFVSTRVHNSQNTADEKGAGFVMTGPTGKGLSIQSSGVHIAFAAGTGVLVYLDLVAMLILRNRAKSTG